MTVRAGRESADTCEQSVCQWREAGYHGLEFVVELQCIEVFVDDVSDNIAEFGNLVRCRFVNNGYGLSEVIVIPVCLRRLLKIRCSESTETIDLVFHCHSEDSGMFDDVRWPFRWNKG